MCRRKDDPHPTPHLKDKVFDSVLSVEDFGWGLGVDDRGVQSNCRKMIIRGKSNKLLKNAYSNAALSTTKINRRRPEQKARWAYTKICTSTRPTGVHSAVRMHVIKVITIQCTISYCTRQIFAYYLTVSVANSSPHLSRRDSLDQCLSTFVRPRPGKFLSHKTRFRSQQIYS